MGDKSPAGCGGPCGCSSPNVPFRSDCAFLKREVYYAPYGRPQAVGDSPVALVAWKERLEWAAQTPYGQVLVDRLDIQALLARIDHLEAEARALVEMIRALGVKL